MAAGQRKKRLDTNSVVACNSREQYKTKKKKLGILKYDQHMRSNISLEWDGKKSSVVAKKDQIGISRRHLIPFVDSVRHCKDILADIITVPKEIFGLENLTDVLSYEVWETYLTEDEQNLLRQFLPKGGEPQGVVQDLLEGNNLDFGNLFLKWGGSLCSGNLHPDVLLHQEKHYRSEKRAYCSFLNKYHDDMIGSLQMWKEKWESCEGPDKEIINKIWLRKHSEKSMSIAEDEYRAHDPDKHLVATSESCSRAADDIACSSDNPYLELVHGEPQGRKGFLDGKYNSFADGLKVAARPKKEVKIHNRSIQCGDGAKYMSYFKVTKEQHQRVKSSMKQSSSSIQQKSLNSVLGGLDTLHVQPYELFEQEEQRKLHDHWLILANRDLPTGFANWREQQLQKRQLIASLGQEIIEKTVILTEDGKLESICNKSPEQTHYAADCEPASPIVDDETDGPPRLHQEQQVDYEMTSHESSIAFEDEEKDKPGFLSSEQKAVGLVYQEPFSEDDDNSALASVHNQHLQQITSFSGSHDTHPMELHSDSDHQDTEAENVSPNRTIWLGVAMPSSVYNSTALSHGYIASNDLSIGHTQVTEEQQPPWLVNLESDLRQEGSRKDLFPGQPNDGSFFTSYPNRDRNELLQLVLKEESLPYHPEQKLQSGLGLQPVANVIMESSQFPGHYPEQLHPSLLLELRQKRLNDLYMAENISENIYSDGLRCAIPGQDHFSPLNIQDREINSIQMSAAIQSHLNDGELLTQNWFPGEQQACIGWPGPESVVGSNQRIGSGSSADQSLYSVLSQCNEIRSGSSRRYIHRGSYGGVGACISTAGNILPQTVNPLNYSGANEAASGPKANNIGWMNLQNQTSALHDPMDKSFFRSWNH